MTLDADGKLPPWFCAHLILAASHALWVLAISLVAALLSCHAS